MAKKGKDFSEDRTARGYYYYLGESNKSKLLDDVALAKSRLTPYAEGGWLDEYLEEDTDDGDNNKKSKPTTRSGIDEELLLRQQFKESSFNPKAKSKAGAKGLAQIMDSVVEDAVKAGVIKKGANVYDPKINRILQEHILGSLWEMDYVNKKNQSDVVKKAKVLTAYNWGRGNLLKHLNEQKAKGVDIYNSLDWLKEAPVESKDYVEKILLKKDPKFEKEYSKAVKNYPYKKANGGWLDKYAGGGNLQNPPANRQDSLRSAANKDINFELAMGATGGTPAPIYAGRQNDWLDIANKQTGYGSAANTAKVADWLWRSGWDWNKGEQKINPKAYILGEYKRKYEKYDPKDWDDRWGWSGRNTASPEEIEKEYAKTVAKLPEQEQQVLTNLAQDWFYKNRYAGNNYYGKDAQGKFIRDEYGAISPDYKAVWAPGIRNMYNVMEPFSKESIQLSDKDKINYDEYYRRQTVPKQKAKGGWLNKYM